MISKLQNQNSDLFNILNEIDNINNTNNMNVCTGCGMNSIYRCGNENICTNCGLQKEIVDKYTDENVSNIAKYINQYKNKTIIQFSKKTKKNYIISRQFGWKQSNYQHDIVSRETLRYMKNIVKIRKKDIIDKYINDIIEKTTYLFCEFNKIKSSRKNIKYGVIANCFYYASKEYFIIYTRQELSNIFGISKTYIGKGCKKIKKIYTNTPTHRDIINKKPIQLKHYCILIDYKFSKIPVENRRHIKQYINRLNNHPYAIKNQPKSILAGILINYFKLKKNLKFNITDDIIINMFGISRSSLVKYEKSLYHLVY